MRPQKRIRAAAAALAGLVLVGTGAIAYGLDSGSTSNPATATFLPALPPAVSSAPPSARATTQPGASTSPSPGPTGSVTGGGDPVFASPVATSACQGRLRRQCYSPAQYQAAYDLAPLYARGITGAGRTIVIVDSFGSPTLQHDLDAYDRQWNLPPLQVKIEKWGDVPAFDPTSSAMMGWAVETTMDVESAHAIAPGAAIVLIETAVAETEGTVGVPEMMDALKRDVDAGRGDVVSMSWGTSEGQFAGFQNGDYTSLTGLRYAFQDAVQHDVTLLASSGDGGGSQGLDASWPAGDPLVTAIGGTALRLDDNGARVLPDTAWSGSGGSTSKDFPRPAYQNSITNVTGDHRLVPDISMSASPDQAFWIYCTADPSRAGWTADGGGTSLSSPLFAGIVALADQAVGHRLGQIDTQIYRLAAAHSPGIVDVTTGSNGPSGFTAGPGYDQATGVGTVDGAAFVKALGG